MVDATFFRFAGVKSAPKCCERMGATSIHAGGLSRIEE